MKKTYNFYPYPSTETIINQTEIKKIENYNEFNFLCQACFIYNKIVKYKGRLATPSTMNSLINK